MKRFKILFLAVITIFIASAKVNAKEVVAKKYNYVYSDTTIADFKEVSILNGINVVYTQSESQAGKVRIYAPEGENVVSLTSKNGLLSIRYGRGYKMDYGVIMVYVYSKELTQVNCSVGANFTTEGIVSGSKLKLKVLNRSQIRCKNIIYDEVYAKRGLGNGDILLAGKVKKATYSIIGNGEIDADNLVADEVVCKIFGKGDIGCHVDKDISVRSIGRGAAYCKGNLKISGENKKIREMPDVVKE
ncbi:MAG: DUF2807 domain-containing protein [Bacteroidales bacterium]|nr:DUF2807 domain-containing protein [Bacteroidales bacterium]MBR5532966.1 DUF2807 domain-containing protein [Bacteroidales bacterium]